MRRARHILAMCALQATIGCDVSASPPQCDGPDCGVAGSAAELRAALSGFTDPVATWLRTAVDADGVVADGPEAALSGLRSALGCSRAEERSFVVLSNADYAPKAILTECSDDPVAASTAFTVFEPDPEALDVDPLRMRMVGWDDDAQTFHRYQFEPHGDGIGVIVEPDLCVTCHGGPFAREPWTPIMNEMTEPWAQWNAAPGFESFAFDETFPAERRGPVFTALTGADRLDSVSEFEPIVRAAIDRVTAARVTAREAPASLDGAVELLRPVFCDESANFVSEVHDSGEIPLAAVLDPGVVRVFRSLAPTASWSFLADDTLVIPAPTGAEEPLVLVGVRGETTVQMEAALLSRRVLEPIDVLRVRALDWTHPVASSYRCDLFARAVEATGEVDASVADNAAMVRVLLDAALAQAGQRSLALADPDRVVAVPNADDPVALAAIARGDLAPYTQTVAELGAAIETHVVAFTGADGRARLENERIRRGCLLRARDPIAPLIPDTDDCPSPARN